MFVVGGGPAGLAAALAARHAGFDVTVADCAEPPIDKACGEGIMPDGLAALRHVGVSIDASQGAPFAGIRFVSDARQVEAPFNDGVGIGVRRTALHQELVNAAERAGIQLLWRRRVTGMADGRVWLDGDGIHCRWTIGADGQNSRVRQLARLASGRTARIRYGFRQHYIVEPWSKFVEVHWADCGQMYVTPIGERAMCVAFITAHKSMRFDDALPHFPQLALRLKGAPAEERPRGAVTASRRLHRVQRGSVALLGEAAGSVDAITGEGLAMAFQQATALAAALRAGDLSQYEAAHRQIMRLPRSMAALMLSMDRHPRFRSRVFGAFAARPEIFARMLAIHTGTTSPLSFGVRNTVSLGWHMLAAS